MDNNNKKRSVAEKVFERLGDIRDEITDQYKDIYSGYEEDRRRKRKQRMYEFYGGKPPRDRKARELYIGLYFLKKIFQGIGTAIFTLFLMFVLTGTIVGTVVAVYLMNFMDSTDSIVLSAFKQSFASYIYEMDPETEEYELIYKVTPESHNVKLPCDINALPDHVKFAFVCIEDERFYAHEGVDFKRTSAAILNLALSQLGVHRSEFGGSTITQQLIKNVTHDDEQTWDRKMREIFRAMKFEKAYTKDNILEAYLNEIYFSGVEGYHMYGIEAASIGYFGKSATELTIAEAAVLAAIPKAPNEYNPVEEFEANKERKEICLYKMFELGVISAEEYEEAMNEEILLTTMPEFQKTHKSYKKLTESDEEFENPAVLSWPLETALNEIGDYLKEKNNLESRQQGLEMFNSGGYKLYLSTDREMQEYLDEKYEDWYYFPESLSTEGQMIQSAIAVMDYKGHILALEGKLGKKTSADNRGFNAAYEGGRQPGSTIKPVTTYGYAIENNIMTYSSFYYDQYLPYGAVPGFDYWPHNYDGAPSGGYYPVYYFLKQSINTLPAQIVYNDGDNRARAVFDFATRKLHLDLDPEWDVDYAPLCIGATNTGPSVINLANAYMPFGNRGRYYKASIISKCVDVMTGDCIINNEKRDYEQAVSEETAYIMNRLMENVITDGTGTAAALWNTPLVGKTGTSEDWRDISFVGLTPDYISAIWIGYDRGTNSWAIEGANSAGIWKSVFGYYADEHASGDDFPACETVAHESYCAYSGMRATSRCPVGGMGYFKPEDGYCTAH
ncbi:transglycosylase domain-containing protein [Ruminococcus sp. HUN007]|uniref:transglycosylase domain-containing protein n=1 Tax=Ruminococcus sp. HUN007 TaxID=1514668 RepID=UPI0005D1ABFD|nr:transglycosylase domain-containing protein [Ruminococcus sp. HUN007]